MPGTSLNVIGIELLVPDLSPAIAVFVDGLGCELVMRGPSPHLAAEVAVLDAGPITITLIASVEADRPSIPDTTPRMSQLVFGGSSEETAHTVARLRAAGLGVSTESTNRPFVTPGVMEGVVGFRTALVMTPMDDPGTGDVADADQ